MARKTIQWFALHFYLFLIDANRFTITTYTFSTAELRAELGTQVDREREMREHVEKQFHEEQKIRSKYSF